MLLIASICGSGGVTDLVLEVHTLGVHIYSGSNRSCEITSLNKVTCVCKFKTYSGLIGKKTLHVTFARIRSIGIIVTTPLVIFTATCAQYMLFPKQKNHTWFYHMHTTLVLFISLFRQYTVYGEPHVICYIFEKTMQNLTANRPSYNKAERKRK